jgi:2-haloacid dehalogenase
MAEPQPAFADIGACLFDAYGTLFDVHAAVGTETQALGDTAGPMSQTWRQKQLQYTWLRSLMGAHADFWQVTGDALDYAMSAHGIADDALRERLMTAYLTLDTYPEVPDALRRLQAAGVRIGILSNGSPDMLRAAVDGAGLGDLLDPVLSIEEVGIYKPDPRVYQLGVDRTEVAAARICFVSANAWDVAGGAHFGYRVAWINRFAQPPECLPGRADAEVATLDEVARLLGV